MRLLLLGQSTLSRQCYGSLAGGRDQTGLIFYPDFAVHEVLAVLDALALHLPLDEIDIAHDAGVSHLAGILF